MYLHVLFGLTMTGKDCLGMTRWSLQYPWSLICLTVSSFALSLLCQRNERARRNERDREARECADWGEWSTMTSSDGWFFGRGGGILVEDFLTRERSESGRRGRSLAAIFDFLWTVLKGNWYLREIDLIKDCWNIFQNVRKFLIQRCLQRFDFFELLQYSNGFPS